MGLPWVRLDTALPRNHKILALVEDKKWQAAFSYVCGLSYSGEQGTAGLLPRSGLPFIHGSNRTAADLVEVGLWVPSPGSWDINGWAEFQPSTEEHEARRMKAKAAAEIRWSKARSNAASNAASINGEQCTDGRTDGLTQNLPSAEHPSTGSNVRDVTDGKLR